MDVTLITSSIYHLPSTHRVSTIVYDGTSDLHLWPTVSPDLDLREAFGPTLPDVLDSERSKLEDEALPIGTLLRLHPGRLHCDFLIWAASRPPHGRTEHAPAPGRDVIQGIVLEALQFAASRGAIRVGIPALGGGPGALDLAERLVLVIQAANLYAEQCFAQKKPAVVEEVVVCDAHVSAVSMAKRKVLGLAKTIIEPVPSRRSEDESRVIKKQATKTTKSATSRTSKPATRTSTKLVEAEVVYARQHAKSYDRTQVYAMGEWLQHPSFGVGKVELINNDQTMQVRFEDNQIRKMIHHR